MKTSYAALIIATALSLLFNPICAGQVIARSTFDEGPEGWLAIGDVASYWPLWLPEGGNSGGAIQITDRQSGDGNTSDQHFSAPCNFVRGLRDANGGTITYALRQAGASGTVNGPTLRDVFILGAGLEIVYDIQNYPTRDWRTYSVPLCETCWRIGGTTVAPTHAQFVQALEQASALWIRAEFGSGQDIIQLDSVVLTGAPGSSCIRITHQPASAAARFGEAVQFVVQTEHVGPEPTYQWRHNGVPVATSPRVSGVTEQVLRIGGLIAADAGSYDCVITSTCGYVTSESASLNVTCWADFNRDGTINSADFFDFLTAFFAGCP